MSARIRIFVVDDEEDLTDLLHYQLGKAGFEVKFSNNPFEALGKARDFMPELIILDVMMPDLDGLQLLRMIRVDNLLQKVPVIMLTAKSGVEHRIKGLEQGADDYLGKPFDIQELTLRIHSILKRVSEKGEDSSTRIISGKLVLDEEDHSISLSGQKIDFTLTEFKLLQYFLKRKGRVQTRDNLLLGVWKFDTEVETRTVDVHIRRVRKKIDHSGLEIETIRGVGYRLIEQPSPLP
ncbi:response regulator transcription factor [Opitutales bacterium]|jgi:two-component system, OmpR family, phosphate regulon response regulator PhoB|nr:response regulator transcription factor [Opitutales bacterium]MDA8989865.1 response regulator transcription factor [Opitutales bacterium]